MSLIFLIGVISLAVWVVLVFARGLFWLGLERDDMALAPANKPGQLPSGPTVSHGGLEGGWPSVTAVIPARNEADGIAQVIASLGAQDYPGHLSIILVDDGSDDGTAELARHAAETSGSTATLTVLTGAELAPGWTGKLWAVRQGINHAQEGDFPPDYLWLTDADIAYAPDTLTRLVTRAQTENRVLVSLMAKLRCQSWAERAFIPAFIYFFQMLYPFGRVNDSGSTVAAAAGGCMLVDRQALARAGGIDSIRDALIDDCALGRRLKTQGSIWLGLSDRAVSLRAYDKVDDIRRMVIRSAYAQLNYSPVLLAGTVLGMLLTYVAPVLLALFDREAAGIFGALAVGLMLASFAPIQAFYRLSPMRAVTLPLIGIVYTVWTVDSAVQHWMGRGGMWKGRAQAQHVQSAPVAADQPSTGQQGTGQNGNTAP
ncbi:glycosyltransferase [Nitrospirillum pindoramense]|uniref:Hopene-associated glycosyltransferase HpnB n=1 Tax=Nitrospirillum amazonense TaxID=28077 RepID=A0A560HAD1_9PROT|nr:glycosyltransferase [Nitrospirillum amazonense]TWB43303.1 hopene-associated glycosyltransferase HpnB [Nitrospirillum amazonense]